MIRYEIIVEGHLSENRLKYFEGLRAENQPDGKTRLWGCLPDQAALFSVLGRIRDMNLPLTLIRILSDSKEET